MGWRSLEENRDLYPLRKPLRKFPETYAGAIRALLTSAHLPQFSDFTADEREEIGLESVPPTAWKFKEAIKELEEISKLIGLEKKKKLV